MMAMKPVPISETLLSPTASTVCFLFLKKCYIYVYVVRNRIIEYSDIYVCANTGYIWNNLEKRFASLCVNKVNKNKLLIDIHEWYVLISSTSNPLCGNFGRLPRFMFVAK